MIWHIGNTTIRNPNRLKNFITAYAKYGPIKGIFEASNSQAQIKLFDIASNANVINSKASSNEDKAFYGRKIRLALKEFGLVASMSLNSYSSDEITETGKCLIDADTDIAILNVYQRIIYNLETRKKGYLHTFRPIPLIIQILEELEKLSSSSYISRNEFALIIQNYEKKYIPIDYVNEILKLRDEADKNKGKLKEFYKIKFLELAEKTKKSVTTIKNDYPDVTIRSLLLSQIFIEKGKGIRFNPQYKKLISIFAADNNLSSDEKTYYEKLANLPPLPFDTNKDVLYRLTQENYEEFMQKEKINKEIIQKPNIDMTINELELIRLRQNEITFQTNEDEFAYQQRNKGDVISKWFECLIHPKHKKINFEDEYIDFDSEDRPQYLEWVVWRAFLSINCLSNKPYHSRKFKLDGNFKPINHAPPGVPDLLFEFEDFNLVVEVTFLSSSRQVANEGEPVRRHVAEISDKSSKPTYCLFLAPKIDINTLDDFKNKEYYILSNNVRPTVKIIPLELDIFIQFFNSIHKAEPGNPKLILKIIKNCFDNTKLSENKWQDYINSQFMSI